MHCLQVVPSLLTAATQRHDVIHLEAARVEVVNVVEDGAERASTDRAVFLALAAQPVP